MSKINWSLIGAIVVVCALIVSLYSVKVQAQEHHHPPQDRAIHEKFYSNWMMPDNRTVSCCHERDCYPTEARKIGPRWEAKRREDGQWLVVPEEKIERDRDNPDGRNHLCAPPPPSNTVYCFILGNGT